MATERRATGAMILDLVKLVLHLEKSHGPLGLSAASQAAIGVRINISGWYDIALFFDLLRVVDRALIKGNEKRALEVGAAGGAALRGTQKAYVVAGDPKSSVMA